MSNKKKYPVDRAKLHALLEKREQELIELQQEVKEIRARALAADRNAIQASCEYYNVTPEQLSELLRSAYGDAVPELPNDVAVAADVSEYPISSEDEEDVFDDDEA